MNWKLWGLLFSQVACIQALAPLKKNIGFVLRERTALTKLIGGGGGEKKVAIKERNYLSSLHRRPFEGAQRIGTTKDHLLCYLVQSEKSFTFSVISNDD